MTWSINDSKELYGISYWGDKFFDVNEKGHFIVRPKGKNGPEIDLYKLTEELKERGIRIPLLLRFPDIMKERIDLLNSCFQSAIHDHEYQGNYKGVYPIKVNQQRHLVEELIRFGQEHALGLECGSKPELLVVLSLMKNKNALIICNGFKDSEYIETALLARKLDRNTIIVVDRFSELPLIIEAAKKFNIKARIGLRAKLHSKGAGRWVDSSGDRSKFGLSPTEMVESVELLEKEGMLSGLELLHFHIGSQIPSISAIKESLKEGARFFTELSLMGAPLKFIDVGGGLGVDYDGSGKSQNSINYSEQEYANDVVSIIQQSCDEKKIKHPTIVTEAGRALVSHQSILIFNVLGANQMQVFTPPPKPEQKTHHVLHELWEIYGHLSETTCNEYFHDVLHIKETVIQLFTFGLLTLKERALAEKLCWFIFTEMKKITEKNLEEFEDTDASLKDILSDTYFCNFSVFQSMPDSWAVNQVFPMSPIQRLDEKPNRQALLVDLTCDSDGKIGQFIDTNETFGDKKGSLEVHAVNPTSNCQTPYYLGVFLVGAYQEILGDLHNLFGDTDAVHILVEGDSYYLDHVVEGNSVEEVLSYVQYQKRELIDNIRKACEQSINLQKIAKHEARLLMRHYEEGLSGYTYLED